MFFVFFHFYYYHYIQFYLNRFYLVGQKPFVFNFEFFFLFKRKRIFFFFRKYFIKSRLNRQKILAFKKLRNSFNPIFFTRNYKQLVFSSFDKYYFRIYKSFLRLTNKKNWIDSYNKRSRLKKKSISITIFLIDEFDWNDELDYKPELLNIYNTSFIKTKFKLSKFRNKTNVNIFSKKNFFKFKLNYVKIIPRKNIFFLKKLYITLF